MRFPFTVDDDWFGPEIQIAGLQSNRLHKDLQRKPNNTETDITAEVALKARLRPGFTPYDGAG